MYVKDCENTKFRKQICEQIEKEIAKNKDKQPTYEQLSDLLSVCHEEYLENIICDSEYWFPKTDYIKNKCFELLSKTNEPKFGELYEKTLLFEAPVRFDSYMLYLEKDREPQNKFYAPKKRCLTKLGLIQAIQDMEEDKLDILSISMPPGSGKEQPLDSKVLTPSGFVEMRDIKVGSKVISGTGKVSNVLGVFPQGKKPVYKVVLEENRLCKCGLEHLWNVYFDDIYSDMVTVTLSSIIDAISNGKTCYVPVYLSEGIVKYLKVVNIKYVYDDYCQCIYIDDESHLYITDDYIITHNTTLEKFFATWVIGRNPDDYSLFYSHSGDITRMFYDGVLDIVSSDEYKWQEIFPRVKLTATNAKLETINFERYKPFPNLQCTSVGAKNSGKVRTNCYLYCDDLIGGIEEAMNKSRLDSLWNIYSVDAKQRKVPGSKEIHIATRWSVHDVIGRIQRLYDGRDRVKFIAVPDIDPETGESNFDYDYNGFSVEFFNDQALSMDEVSYRCLYKNEPIEREGLLFTEDKVRRYLNLPEGEPDEIIAQCDTKSKGIDFMVMPVMYRYGDDYYCVDAICNDGADFELQYESLADMLVHHEVNACEFERNMGGDRVASEVNKRVEEKGWICNITDMPTETNKEARIFQCSNWVMQHILFKDATMYSPQSDYGVMMSQLFSYSITGKNPHDDVPDVFSNFALRMTRGQKSTKAEVFDRRMLGF